METIAFRKSGRKFGNGLAVEFLESVYQVPACILMDYAVSPSIVPFVLLKTTCYHLTVRETYIE